MLATHRLVIAALVGLVAGCFSETTPPLEGCQGCACYPNGTCDPGLSCDDGASRCIPTGCMPGTLDCTCGSGCASPLICDAGVCAMPGVSTGAQTGDSADTSAASSSSVGSTTTATTSTSGPTTSTSTTDADTTDGTSDTGSDTCPQMDCAGCLTCTVQPGHACAPQAMACEPVNGCSPVSGCVYDCAAYGICSDCCETGSTTAHELADDLTQCWMNECAVACPRAVWMTCAS